MHEGQKRRGQEMSSPFVISSVYTPITETI